jgi:hypothetical protein
VRRHCSSAGDRSDCCYRCGIEGNRTRDCLVRVPKCPLCADLGLPASHRMGSPECKPSASRRRAVQETRPAPDEGCRLARRRGGRHSLLQCNLNHSRRAQDLMPQSSVERKIGLAVVAEPYSIPDTSRGARSLLGLVAILWTGIAGNPSCSIIEQGRRFVAVKWDDLAVVGVYVSPTSARRNTPPSWTDSQMREASGRQFVADPRGLQRTLHGVGFP